MLKMKKKILVFTFDDGTVHDIKFINILNKYGLKGTFNLNTGLANYVWYKDGIAIYRLDLNEYKYIYDGHEVASHTLTHPHMTEIDDESVIRESKEDIKNLEKIFNRKINSFAFPFHDFSKREIELIKNNNDLTNIRVSEVNETFSFPKDIYSIPITTFKFYRAKELYEEFIKLDEGLFVFAGHSYDYYVDGTFDEFEKLVKQISENKDIEVMTMSEMVKYLGGKK